LQRRVSGFIEIKPAPIKPPLDTRKREENRSRKKTEKEEKKSFFGILGRRWNGKKTTNSNRRIYPIFRPPPTTSTVTSLIGLMVMLVLATALFGLPFFAYGLTLVPFLLILFLFGVSLGICTCAWVLRLGPSAEWLVWPVPAVISPFAGVFYPISILPHWMQFVGKLLPVSYVFEGLRKIIAGGTVPVTSLILGGGLAIIYVLLACWFFKRVFRHAVRTGILARYSAESPS
jgi:ABC-type polysaccharide/polyol phosphate export permease